jgi:hypothetical protein
MTTTSPTMTTTSSLFPSFQELLSQHTLPLMQEPKSDPIPFPVPEPAPSPLLSTQIFAILATEPQPEIVAPIETPVYSPFIEFIEFIEPIAPLAPIAPLSPIAPIAPMETEQWEKDDLLQLTGVTPIIEQLLHKSNIYTYQQIMQWSQQDVEKLGTLSITIMPRFRRFQWREQACALYTQKYGMA